MKKERHQQYIKAQIKLIKKAIKKNKNNQSENEIFMAWATKWGKKFRKNWVENDIKEALHKLDKIIEKTDGEGCKIIANVKEQLEEAMGLLEE